MLLAIAGGMAFTTGDTSAGAHRTPGLAVASRAVGNVAPTAAATAPRARRTAAQVAEQTIREHRAALEADPRGEDAPAQLSAMGNLYRHKLMNYQEAAQCFEQVIWNFPEWPGKADAFLQLLYCYEKLGDQENHRRVLRQMTESFPADSQEYLYAYSLLYP
jgi:tetratricopeptide (TPR) repeat protein